MGMAENCAMDAGCACSGRRCHSPVLLMPLRVRISDRFKHISGTHHFLCGMHPHPILRTMEACLKLQPALCL
jgi:hypothetical protein